VDWLEAKRARIVDSLRALSADIADAILINGVDEPNGTGEELPDALSAAARRERGRLRR
jgi:hypothetical protein